MDDAPPRAAQVRDAPQPLEPAASERDWLSEAAAPFWAKARPFLETAREFALRPRPFAERWARGEGAPMNPLLFVATAATVLGLAQRLANEAIGQSGKQTFWRYALEAIAPYLYYAELGLIAHGMIRLVGGRRGWRSTVAMALYAGGSLASLAMLWTIALLALVRLSNGGAGLARVEQLPLSLQIPIAALAGIASVLFVLFINRFAQSVGALHQLSKPRLAAALVSTVFLSALIAAWLPLPTIQLVIGHGHTGIRFPSDEFLRK